SSVGGVYTTIGGSPSGNSVNNGGLGSQSPEYLTLVNAFLNAVKLGSTNAGVDASCNPVNGSLTVGGVGGTPPYTFSMDGSAFTATTTYNNLTKGNHTVIIKDNTGATSTTIMKVLGPVQINGDDKDLNYCNTGPAVVLTASNLLNGSPTYSWSPGGQTTASISVTPAVATTYTVTSQVLIPGSNLLTGGSFESGLPTGMSGGFTANGGGYGTTPDPGGYYKIGTAGNQLCTFFTALPAQSGTQYYIADGNKNGNALVFNLSLASYGIVAGQTYTFSYWYAEGSNHPNKATLRTTFANGTLISGSGDITTANYGGWLQASYTFTATTTSPTISLTDIAVFGSTNGDDFYLDNLQLIHLNSCPLTTSVKVTPGCPLPVELVNFDATKKGSDALLTWTTSSEKNSLYFLVEKSSDGISFTGIGKVNAAGNTSAIQQYSFTDQNLASGVTYYRLAQYDVDGSVYYSMIKAVSNMVGTVQVIPNPNNGTFVVALDHTGNKKTHVRIVNSLGQVVYENTVSSDSVMNVDISLLASAVYYLEVITDEDLIVKKIVKE
ncbi:MAG: T9SS type A sorting domain-containing protein, partial [Cytophagaceae bacterium]